MMIMMIIMMMIMLMVMTKINDDGVSGVDKGKKDIQNGDRTNQDDSNHLHDCRLWSTRVHCSYRLKLDTLSNCEVQQLRSRNFCMHFIKVGNHRSINKSSSVDVVVVVFVYFILSRMLYLAYSANLGLLCMPHPGMRPLV